jgi:hypothetical protein
MIILLVIGMMTAHFASAGGAAGEGCDFDGTGE